MAYDAEQPFTIVHVPAPPQEPDDGLNRENIRKVRDRIATLDGERFNMGRWPNIEEFAHDCGTAACIGGWAEFVNGRAFPSGEKLEAVGRMFGVSTREADRLCFPPTWMDGVNTRAQAVAVLDHLIATGEVDWSVAEGLS
jgi:hypothetical protein